MKLTEITQPKDGTPSARTSSPSELIFALDEHFADEDEKEDRQKLGYKNLGWHLGSADYKTMIITSALDACIHDTLKMPIETVADRHSVRAPTSSYLFDMIVRATYFGSRFGSSYNSIERLLYMCSEGGGMQPVHTIIDGFLEGSKSMPHGVKDIFRFFRQLSIKCQNYHPTDFEKFVEIVNKIYKDSDGSKSKEPSFLTRTPDSSVQTVIMKLLANKNHEIFYWLDVSRDELAKENVLYILDCITLIYDYYDSDHEFHDDFGELTEWLEDYYVLLSYISHLVRITMKPDNADLLGFSFIKGVLKQLGFKL